MSDLESSVLALLGVAEEQEKTAKGSIAALSVAVKELRTTSETLKTGVERAISDNMGKVVLTTEKAVLEASRASADRLQAATQAVETAQKQFSMLWIAVPVAAILALAAVACLGVWLITMNWRAEMVEMRASVAQLEAKGGKAQLTKCNDNGKSRLCIKVDTANSYKDDFMVIKGY